MDTPVSRQLAAVDDFVRAIGEVLESHAEQLKETLGLVADNDEVREALQRRINRE
jgi:hypothetical protein